MISLTLVLVLVPAVGLGSAVIALISGEALLFGLSWRALKRRSRQR